MLKLKWIPNTLSSSRFLTAIAFPFLPQRFWLVAVVFALLTEFFDGFLARRFNWVSHLGQILDPMADKVFALSVGFTFVFSEKLVPGQLVLIIFRDLIAGLGFLLYFRSKTHLPNFQPRLLGKAATFFQYALFLNLLVNIIPSPLVIYVTETVSVLAGIDYAIAFQRKRREPL